jgi:WW domain-containing oxidoreductase
MPGTVVITGPNGGMATLTTREYAKLHPDDHLILLVRNPSSLPNDATPPSDKVKYEVFDMSDITDVRHTAAGIAAKVASGALPPIKSIVCSAAVLIVSPDQPRITKDGYEETMAVNHLAHFALILDLLPSMAKDGQVIIVGSSGVSLSISYSRCIC